MITRAAVVPHPPLLVPELVAGAVSETAELRAESVAVARWLTGGGRRLVAVGTADPAGWLDRAAVGTFAGFGPEVVVSLSRSGDGTPDPWMPLPGLIAGWLRAQIEVDEIPVLLVSPAAAPADCLALGAWLSEFVAAQDTGLLVLGDGSNRHGPRAPGNEDDRAPGYDEAVQAELGRADTAALAARRPEMADELGVSGRAAWQVLAGLPGTWRSRGARLFIPYGVAYHVAHWEAG